MTRPRVVVVGLGPAGPELITPQVAELVERAPIRVLRTSRHPAAVAVPDASTCDDLYETADVFDDVYLGVVERLVDLASTADHVVYAVPGSPLVLERSVDLLRADARVDVQVIPAMSFLDVAWSRLGIDPVEAGVRLIDGHRFAVQAAGERGPLLVAHCHNQRVLSDIKLAVAEPADTRVSILQRLGLPDERVTEVAWQDLDRTVEADHLTCVFIAEMASPVAGELVRFGDLVRTLREQCPWDRAQTHRSLRRHLIEEAYEVLDAIDGFDPDTGVGAEDLEEELGDLLFQVFLHAAMAAEEGWFDLGDVARTVHDKLYERHPHVFGDHEVAGAEELLVTWEERKLAEKGRASVLDGIPLALPALSLAEKTVKKAGAIGSPLPDELVVSLRSAFEAAVDEPSDEAVGAILLALAAWARDAGIDPEMALRAATGAAAATVRAFETERVDDAAR